MPEVDEGEEVNQRGKWYKIDTQLLPIKAFYFFMVGGMGCLYPFLGLYMKSIGLSSKEAGIIHGTMPIIGFLVRPIIGHLADRLKMNTVVLMSFCVLNGALHLLLLLVPDNIIHEKYITMKTLLHCNRYNSYIHDCVLRNGSQGTTNCPMMFSDYVQSGFYHSYDVKKQDQLLETNSPTNRRRPSSWHDELAIRCSLNCSYTHDTKSRIKICLLNNTFDAESMPSCLKADMQFSLKQQEVLRLQLAEIAFTVREDKNGKVLIEKDSNCTNFLLSDTLIGQSSFKNMFCSSDLQMSCRVKCTDVEHQNRKCIRIDRKYKTSEWTTTFWIFSSIFLLACIFSSPIMSLGDSITLNMIPEERDLWSKQKLWGTLGYAIFAVITTLLIDIFSNHQETKFHIAFYIFIFLMTLSSLVSCTFCVAGDFRGEKKFKEVKTLFKNTEITIVFSAIAFFGFMHGAYDTFLFWFLQDYHHNNLLIIPGVAMLIGCTSETILSFSSGLNIKLIGFRRCIYLGFVAFAARFTCFSIITEPWQILSIEILYGVNMGLVLAAMTTFASAVAPSEMFLTMNSITRCLHFGFGKGAGSIITGILYSPSVLGIIWTFRLYAILCGVGLIIFIILNRFCIKTCKSNKQKVGDRRNVSMASDLQVSDDNVAAPINASKGFLENCPNDLSEDGNRSFSGISLDSRSEEVTRGFLENSTPYRSENGNQRIVLNNQTDLRQNDKSNLNSSRKSNIKKEVNL